MRACSLIATLGLTISFAARVAAQTPLNAAFTYQGRLDDAGQPANGEFALDFRLFDAATTPPGVQLGATISLNVPVANGVFSVLLNDTGQFGALAFDGQGRFLEIAVNGAPLTPRQPLNAAPHATFAMNADVLDGLDSAAFLQTVPVPLNLSGSDTNGVIRGINASATQFSAGVYGENTATGVGTFVGGRFVSQGSTATGVLGEGLGSLGTGGTFRGGGIGLSARATNPNVSGGVAVSAVCESGSLGKGVSALVTAPTSETFGVRAESQSNAGTGVFGLASANSGETFGVRAESESNQGIGVFGLASAISGQTIGVLGQAESGVGTGVLGLASVEAGSCVGVRGTVLSVFGTAGHFENLFHPELTVELAGPDGAINTAGFLNREYTANTPRCAIPIAYGSIGTTGAINGGTGNFTVSHTVTGEYDITINGQPYSNLTFVVTITPITNSPRVTGVADAGAAFRVNMWNMSSTLVDDDFQFTVWTANPN